MAVAWRSKLLPADLAGVAGEDQLALGGEAAEVAQQGLGVGEGGTGAEAEGTQVALGAGALGAGGGPADIEPAADGEQLTAEEAQAPDLLRRRLEDGGARELLVAVLTLGARQQIVDAERLVDAERRLGAVVALHDQAEVLGQRDLERPVERQQDGAVLHLGLDRRGTRRHPGPELAGFRPDGGVGARHGQGGRGGAGLGGGGGGAAGLSGSSAGQAAGQERERAGQNEPTAARRPSPGVTALHPKLSHGL